MKEGHYVICNHQLHKQGKTNGRGVHVDDQRTHEFWCPSPGTVAASVEEEYVEEVGNSGPYVGIPEGRPALPVVVAERSPNGPAPAPRKASRNSLEVPLAVVVR